MKRRIAACMAVLIAACTSTPPTDTAPRDLRVATLNIYHDRAGWPQRLPLIVEQLRALDADVIALQEVLQRDDLPNQASTIGAALGYSVQFVSSDPPDRAQRYGNALLTRLPVLGQAWTALEPREDSRTLGHARLQFQGAPIDVYFTHLHHTREGGGIRRRQLEAARAFIASRPDPAASLLLGDFNAPATAPELAALEGYVDSYGALHPEIDSRAVTTLNPDFFDVRARIDHVFAEAGRFELREARIVLDAPGADGTWPSDHFGLLVALRPLAR